MIWALLCGALGFLAICNWIVPEQLWIWRLSVGTREYGHWLAIGAVLSFALSIHQHSVAGMALSLVALGSFLLPLAQALKIEKSLAHDLVNEVGGAPPKLIEITRLFRRPLKIPFERSPFKTTTGEELTLDFYPARSQSPAPWVLVIHGGGWESGDTEQLAELNSYLADQGFGVVAATYRLSPQAQWPAQQEDIHAAIQHVKHNASRWNLDFANWAILGRSAGAQIAGVMAFKMRQDRPQAFISLYGPTDLVFGYEVGAEDDILASRGLIRKFLGGSPFEKLELFEDASILHHLHPDVCPTLLLHGVPDMLVWYKHSERLHVRLKNLKRPSAFLLLPWGVHGFDYNLHGPGGQITAKSVLHFLKQTLSNKSPATPH